MEPRTDVEAVYGMPRTEQEQEHYKVRPLDRSDEMEAGYLTESLQRIIQEEYETMVGPEIVTDPLTGQEYEDPYGGIAANLATFGEAYPFDYDPYAAPEGYQIPHFEPPPSSGYYGGPLNNAYMSPEESEANVMRAEQERAEQLLQMKSLLDPGPEGPTEEQVRNELIRQEMERNQ